MEPTVQFDSVGELLPHEKPLLLLDGVQSYGAEHAEVYVDNGSMSMFSEEDGRVPAWVGIEYMAQAIGVFAGIYLKKKGKQPQIGFLLGTRKYESFITHFEPNTRIYINAVREYHSEDNLVQFACTIKHGDRLLAKADIKAIQPENPKELLKAMQ